MGNIWGAIQRNPVRVYSIISALLVLLDSLGFQLSDAERNASYALVAALLGGGEIVHRKVVPVATGGDNGGGYEAVEVEDGDVVGNPGDDAPPPDEAA